MSSQKLKVEQALAAGADMQLNASQLDNSGTLEAGIGTDASTNPAVQLQINSGELNNTGAVSNLKCNSHVMV